MPKSKRNLGSVDLNEREPVTYKGNFPDQLSDDELMAELEKAAPDDKSVEAEPAKVVSPEPDRPKFADLSNRKPIVRDQYKADVEQYKDAPAPKSQDFKTDDIQKLLSDLDTAQKKDKSNSKSDRRHYWALKEGEAISSGMNGLPADSSLTMPAKYNETQGVEKRAGMYDKLLSGEEKRQNPEQERELKDILARFKAQEDENRLKEKITAAVNDREDKQIQQNKIEGMKEGGRNDRTDKLVKGGLVAGANRQQTGAGAQAGRQAAEEEYKQGPRYYKRSGDGRHEYHAIGVVEDRQSAAADDQLKAYSKLKPAIGELQALLQKDPSGAALWGSDVRNKILTASIFGLEANVKYQGDGVMNGRDLDNAKMAMGDPKVFEQWIANNGPAHLIEASKIMDSQLDSVMKSLNYDVGPGTGPKQLKDLHNAAGSAAGSMQRPIAPADLNKEYGWIIGHGPAPDPGSPAGMPSVDPPQNAQKRKVIKMGPNGPEVKWE